MYYIDPHEIISSLVTPLMDTSKRAREYIVEISLNDAPVPVVLSECAVDRCVELGLRRPEFRQDEDFMVVMWRRDGSGMVQSDPEVDSGEWEIIG